MTQATAEARPTALVDRLARGAELLFDMELHGDFGSDYQRWLALYEQLLREYEETLAA